MILAAGTGTRLLPLTNLRPKPLFPIYTIPLLSLIITQLKGIGVKDIIINTHHLHQHISNYFRENTPADVNITLSHEPSLLGTGGGIKNVEYFWDDQPFIVVNGDSIHTIDLDAAYQYHLTSGNLATLVLHTYPRYHHVEIDQEKRIVGIRGERVKETSTPTYLRAFTGIHIISPLLLREISPRCYADIITIYRNLIAQGMKVCGYHVENHYWRDIGTPEDYHHIHSDIFHKRIPLMRDALSIANQKESIAIGKGTLLEGYVSVGSNTSIGKKCIIRNSIIWDEVEVSDNLTIEDCIIGDRIKVNHSLKGKVVVE